MATKELCITLLGNPGVTLDGEPVSGFVSSKAQALVFYLAATGHPHTRETLVGLLWSDRPERAARRSLRNALTNLRRLIGPYLDITRQTVALNREAPLCVDSERCAAKLSSVQWAGSATAVPNQKDLTCLKEVVDLYRGEFLAGFYVTDAPLFEEWMLAEREHLRRELEDALERLVRGYSARGEFKPAIAFGHRWLALDPLREAAHRALIELHAWSGDRSAASRQYQACAQLLADELGVEPAERTQEMYERLLKGELPIAPAAVEAILERELRTVGECPYRSLAPFREADARFFFGREAFTERLAEAVRTQPLVVVIVGSSGSGKSSAVFAGLLPQLRKVGDWLIVDFRPGGQPFQALAAALLPILEPDLDETDRPIETRKLVDALSQEDIPLSDVAERALEKSTGLSRLLLLVDQFEELYTLCPQPETRQRFLDILLAAIEAVAEGRESPFVLLLTMRADFMGQALTHRPFVDVLQESSLLLGPMTREELRTVIEKPAEKQGAALEAGLVERLLDDVGDEPGNLPLLEFALTLLWERLDRGWMTHRAYEEIGQVEGALARYAQQVHDGLEQEERERAQHVFVQLVQPGEGTEDTRRVATQAEMGEDNWSLVQYLAEKRLVVTGRDPTTGSETVEVVHEALIGRWAQLRAWIDADRAFRTWQERLRATLYQWEVSNRDEGALLRGALLAEAESWMAKRRSDLSSAESSFIQASIELRERRKAMWEAQRLRELTQISIGLASQAMLELEGSFPERAVLLALEALENYPYTWQAERALGQAVLGCRLRLSLQHKAIANTACWSSDEARILTASDDGTAKVWDANTGEMLLTLSGHKGFVQSAIWSPSEEYILTASKDGSAKVWDVSAAPVLNRTDGLNTGATTADELLTLSHKSSVNMAIWSSSGEHILTASDDFTAKVWDANTGESLLTLSGHEGWVAKAVWSPSEEHILTSSADNTARVWDANTGEELLTLSGHQDLSVWASEWSPDGMRIVTAGQDGIAKVWDAVTGEELLTLIGHTLALNRVAWSPSGDRIATSGFDPIARVWDATTGEELFTLAGHADNVRSVAWSPSGDRLLTASQEGTAKVWEASAAATTGTDLLTLFGHTGPVGKVAWSPLSDRILTASDDGTAKVWDPDPALLTIAGLEGLEGNALWSPRDDRVAVGFRDGTTKVWDVVTGEELLVLSAPERFVGPGSWSPSDDRLVIVNFMPGNIHEAAARVWDAFSGKELFALYGHSGAVMGANWSPDGARIVTAGTGDGTARIWDADTGAELFTFTGHKGGVTMAAWSPDGKTIATSSHDGTAKIWDAATGHVFRDLYTEGLEYHVTKVAWSPDGRRIATYAQDGTGRIWDVTTGDELTTFTGHTSHVWVILWSRTGERIFTSSTDHTVRVWDTATGAELLRYDVGGFVDVALSPDETRIAVSIRPENTLKVFPTWQTLQGLIDYARKYCVVRELTDAERELLGLPPR